MPGIIWIAVIGLLAGIIVSLAMEPAHAHG